MKPLVGLLLVVSGTVLAVPAVYDALASIEYERSPIVPVVLGVACIIAGLVFLVVRPRRSPPEAAQTSSLPNPPA